MHTRRPRPISRITTLLLITLFLSAYSVWATENDGDDDLEGLEELLAIDEELEQKGEVSSSPGKPSSEAEVLSRAQRIVVELSNENAKRVVDGNEYVMLLGYTPWCERSAELMPRFAEAATALRELGSPVLVAKLDAERHTKAASLFGIRGFPTLLLFVNGSAQSYKGGFTTEEIVIWARKKTGSPTIRLSSVAAAKEFLAKHQQFVICFFENYEGSEHSEFVKAAVAEDELQFVETDNINVAKVLFPDTNHKNNFLGLVKSEPERFLTFDEDFEEGRILKFIEYNKFPLVTTLTEANSARVYSSPIKLQVFVIAETAEFKHLLLLVQDVARKYKTKIMFIHVDAAEHNLAKPFMTLFGIESDKPIVIAFDSKTGSKHLLESDLTADNLDEFSNGLLHGTLPHYYKSEPIPDTKEIVKKVVGKTFAMSVLDSSENVFLEIYTPWCMDCEATSKQIEKLAGHFEGRSDLVFARIDASVNEHPKLQINSFPTLLFYPSGAKPNLIKVSKKSSLKDMIAFVEKHLKSEGGILKEDQKSKDEL